jgi:hypothetical protein
MSDVATSDVATSDVATSDFAIGDLSPPGRNSEISYVLLFHLLCALCEIPPGFSGIPDLCPWW